MTMTEPPRRTRLQIHLSTAVVMMFVAGGLMWAHFRYTTERWLEVPEDKVERTWKIDRERFFSPTIWYNYRYHIIETGWPTAWSCRILEERGYFSTRPARKHEKSGVRTKNIVINVIFGLASLAVVGFLSEWLNRRRMMTVLTGLSGCVLIVCAAIAVIILTFILIKFLAL